MKENARFMLLLGIINVSLEGVGEEKYHLKGFIICHLFHDSKTICFNAIDTKHDVASSSLYNKWSNKLSIGWRSMDAF